MHGTQLTTSGKFLRSDYSIEYETGKWAAFLPVTLIILLLFVFGFPLLIIVVLFKNRHHLHSPHNRRRLGFIYKPFVVGAEFWELHEVFRKDSVIGSASQGIVVHFWVEEVRQFLGGIGKLKPGESVIAVWSGLVGVYYF